MSALSSGLRNEYSKRLLLRECHWGLHLDNNNQANPETNGWIVRLWLELTDDDSSARVVRSGEFDRKSEARIPLPHYQQVSWTPRRSIVVGTGYHHGPAMRYAVIVSLVRR